MIKSHYYPFLLCVIFALLTLFSSTALSAQLNVAVLSPQVKSAAYNRVFTEIIDGIQENKSLNVTVYPLEKGEHYKRVETWVKANNIDAVIALGQRSYKVGSALRETVPVIHGGVMIEPDGHSGISLVADPSQIFKQLKRLAPQVNRVFTVYSKKSNGWLIEMAKEAAKQQGIELVAHEATNLRESMHDLKSILDQVKNEHDGVWLLLDQVVPDKGALPMVLEAAWDRRFVVFSSNPSHTKRGALFAMFPDHFGLGKGLGEMVTRQVGKGAKPQVLPSRSLTLSVNERTASHLGFSYTQAQRTEFDLVYPVQ